MTSGKSVRNRFRHNSVIKGNRGISSIVSTVIISGTLLVVLAIASFVSANVLELQLASTEFEQAKTNMMLLDEVIQDVATRRGSGGYVQFNQRSGGIGTTQQTEKIKVGVIGAGTQAIAINSPSSVPAGTWTNPANAYASDNLYASTSTDGAVQQYGNYRFNLPPGTPIIKVEVGYEAYTAGNEKIGISCSWDNGITWAVEIESPSLPVSDPNTVTWVDFTSATSWTPSKLSDANFRTRAKSVKVGSMSNVYLDWIPVRVTYVGPETIYESSPNLISLVYRGGSVVSGADMTLRGNKTSLNVSMTRSLSYLGVETGKGTSIVLDYNRVRIVEAGSLLIDETPYNVIEMTFLRLQQGKMGGTGTVNFKVRNLNVVTITRRYDSGDITIQIELGPNIASCMFYSGADKTLVILTEIVVEGSTG